MVELEYWKEKASQNQLSLFIIPKSNQTVQFISDFYELNKLLKLKHKHWTLPKIVETLQVLEGFTYYFQLDLNTGLFTIRQDQCYHPTLGEIFLSEVTNECSQIAWYFPGENDGFNSRPQICQSVHRWPTDNFEIFVQRSSSKIRKSFGKLHKDGLKVNCAKSTFGMD